MLICKKKKIYGFFFLFAKLGYIGHNKGLFSSNHDLVPYGISMDTFVRSNFDIKRKKKNG